MMPPESFSDSTVAKLIGGIAGSVVSMRFIVGTLLEKIVMAFGGSVLSYYATPPLSDWLGIEKAEGLIGFLIGLFGMALVSKGYEVIQLMDAKQIAADVWEWVKKKWSA